MYKYLLTAIIIAIFAACSAPKPDTAPSWYTTLPKDFNYFYARGTDVNADKAKKKAIAALRKNINAELDNSFVNKTTKLTISSNQNIDAILMANERLVNTLSMRSIKLDKTAIFKNNTLVLLKLSKKEVFNSVDRSLRNRLNDAKKKFELSSDDIAIKRFVVVSELMKDYPKYASKVQAKEIALNSYDTYDEFSYLNDLYNSYMKLKKDITIYVLSDMNSRIFTASVKNAIRNTGLLLASNSKGKDSIKLLITSKTIESQDYSFNQSKSLIKFITYDVNKKQVSFKQHTFIGKSRKNYKEAKEQSALHVKSKISQLGIFKFLGLHNKI